MKKNILVAAFAVIATTASAFSVAAQTTPTQTVVHTPVVKPVVKTSHATVPHVAAVKSQHAASHAAVPGVGARNSGKTVVAAKASGASSATKAK